MESRNIILVTSWLYFYSRLMILFPSKTFFALLAIAHVVEKSIDAPTPAPTTGTTFTKLIVPFVPFLVINLNPILWFILVKTLPEILFTAFKAILFPTCTPVFLNVSAITLPTKQL